MFQRQLRTNKPELAPVYRDSNFSYHLASNITCNFPLQVYIWYEMRGTQSLNVHQSTFKGVL